MARTRRRERRRNLILGESVCRKWGGGCEIKAGDAVEIWKEYTAACKISFSRVPKLKSVVMDELVKHLPHRIVRRFQGVVTDY